METASQPNLRTYITSDNVKYELDYQTFAACSMFIKDMEPEEVRFNNIDSLVFKYIIKYLELRKANPEPR